MKRKRPTEEQIIAILKEHEAGVKTADWCRTHGISEATFDAWKLSKIVHLHVVRNSTLPARRSQLPKGAERCSDFDASAWSGPEKLIEYRCPILFIIIYRRE
jgi:putative transposase